jgi:hypothetical protein
MLKKMALAAVIACAATTVVSVPASAAVEGFTLQKEVSGHGRTLRMWKNNSNGLVHGNLSGAWAGDQLSIGSCCYPYTTYETVTSNGTPELNTQEYRDYGPNLNAALNGGGELHL